MDQASNLSFPTKETNFIRKYKNYSLISEQKKKYSIVFETTMNSEINITAIEDNYQKKYSQIYSFKSLKKYKYLSSLDTLDEIFDEIINKINLKTPTLNEESNNLKIVIETFHSKYKEITFYLEGTDKNANDKIEELFLLIEQIRENEKKKDNLIKSLEVRICNYELKEKRQEEIIKKLEERIDELEKSNSEIKEKKQDDIMLSFEERIVKLEKGNSELKEKNEILLETFNIDSLILKNNFDYILTLKNWINPNKNLEFKILYRMSRDGTSIKIFHSLCDNKGPTISLYLLKDGNIVGGYTSLNYNSFSGWKSDNEAFVFNLNKKLKCMSKKDYNIIFFRSSYSGFVNTLGYYEASQDSMRNLFYFNSDYYFIDGNKLLDYKKKVELEAKEVEVLSVLS